MAATEPVWVASVPDRDRYGDAPPVETVWYAPRAVCIPRRGRESNQGGIVAVDGHEVFIRPVPPWASEVKATDTVLLRGQEHEIDGVPAIYKGKALQIFTKRVGST